MRNTPADHRGAWATFAKAARVGARLTQAELARRLEVERTTVWRWETERQKPESADVVQAFASATGIDLDEALAAAGLRPGVTAPATPTRDLDEEEERILAADVDQRTKELALEQLHRMRMRDKERRSEVIDLLLNRDTA